VNALAFGNSPVMLPLLRKHLVDERPVITLDELLYAYAVGQVTPGQANLYMASIGYLAHGMAGAVATTLAIVLPGYSILALLRVFDRLRDNRFIRRFTRGMIAASVGMIFATVIQVGRHSLTQPASWVAFFLTLLLVYRLKWNPIFSLLTASAVGILLKLALPG